MIYVACEATERQRAGGRDERERSHRRSLEDVDGIAAAECRCSSEAVAYMTLVFSLLCYASERGTQKALSQVVSAPPFFDVKVKTKDAASLLEARSREAQSKGRG